jgi:hypothetical protein
MILLDEARELVGVTKGFNGGIHCALHIGLSAIYHHIETRIAHLEKSGIHFEPMRSSQFSDRQRFKSSYPSLSLKIEDMNCTKCQLVRFN